MHSAAICQASALLLAEQRKGNLICGQTITLGNASPILPTDGRTLNFPILAPINTNDFQLDFQLHIGVHAMVLTVLLFILLLALFRTSTTTQTLTATPDTSHQVVEANTQSSTITLGRVPHAPPTIPVHVVSHYRYPTSLHLTDDEEDSSSVSGIHSVDFDATPSFMHPTRTHLFNNSHESNRNGRPYANDYHPAWHHYTSTPPSSNATLGSHRSASPEYPSGRTSPSNASSSGRTSPPPPYSSLNLSAGLIVGQVDEPDDVDGMPPPQRIDQLMASGVPVDESDEADNAPGMPAPRRIARPIAMGPMLMVDWYMRLQRTLAEEEDEAFELLRLAERSGVNDG